MATSHFDESLAGIVGAPSVSVILPARNCEKFLALSIASILNQTLEELELLLIDDGSEDGTAALCREAADRDPRVVYLNSGGAGLVAALNLGISEARAPLLARMDCDDIAHSRRLERQVGHLHENPPVAVVGSWVRLIDSDGVHHGEWRYESSSPAVAARMESGSAVAHPAVLMRTHVVRRLGGYRPIFRSCEDYDLWMRVLDAGYQIQNLPEILLDYRIHSDSVSAKESKSQMSCGVAARISHRLRVGGIPHSFGDGDGPLDPDVMWDEVPPGALIDLRAVWAVRVRDGLVPPSGWRIDEVTTYLRSTRSIPESGPECARALWFLASDARARRAPVEAARWLWLGFKSNPRAVAAKVRNRLKRLFAA